jgi:EmrB/QacA subfamily drug resistance transporter
MTQALAVPISEDILRRRWWILGVLCTSLLVVMLGNTALNIVLPTLSRDLGATSAQQQWMVDAYSLVFAGLLFTASSLGERFGRKGVMQIGLLLFGGSALYAGLVAATSAEIIASRIVMGAAGAMIMPSTLSILTNVFPREERAKAVAIWAGVAGGGGAIGMLLSGFVIERFDWPAVFLVVVPVVIASLVAGWFLVPNSRDPESTSLDIPGAVFSTAGLSALVYGLIEAPRVGWTSFETLGLIAAGLTLMAVFTMWELRNKQPMLDVRLFARPAFGVSSLTLTLVFFTLMGIFFSVAQLFQLVMGYGAFESALRMAPIFLFMMVAAPISPQLALRFGKRRVVALGLATLAIGIGTLSFLPADPSYLHVLIGMGIMATGMGLAMSPTTDLLMSAVPRTKAGMGSATNDTTRELGGALGVAVLGSIIASRFASELAPAVSALPDGPRGAAESSLGGAVMVASQLGGQQGEALLQAASAAWMSGLELAMVAGAIIVAGAALLAFVAMPDRAHDDVDEVVDDEPFEPLVHGPEVRVPVGAGVE